MRAVDVMLDILRDEGVDRVFGNPGTTELPFTEALAGVPDIAYVLALQEASAVAMADGYARATRRPAFVSLHVAAGLANGLIGLLNASRSRTPLVVTAGQQDRRHLAQDPMLSGDLVGLARAAVKQAFDVQHAYDLPVMLRRAFAAARRSPAGPVFLSIPMDLLTDEVTDAGPGRSVIAPLGVSPAAGRAAELLEAGDRPVIVAGDAVGRDGAVAELVTLAEALGATVYHQPMHDNVDFPGSHPLHAGMLPTSNADIRERLAAHDVALVVGCHAFMPHHYTPGPAVPPAGLTVVQLDTDPAELGRTFAVDLGLVGELPATLAAIADRVGASAAARRRLATAASQSASRQAATEAEAQSRYGPAPFDTLAAAHAIAAALPGDAVLVEEAITAGVALRRVLALDRPDSLVHTVGGGLGYGIGAAIGRRMADPSRPVVAVLGDGCTMFGLQGLWSAARYDVPVTFVVMNNGEYRTLKDTLDNRGDAGRYVGLDLGPPRLDFRRAADFFGIEGVTVTETKELSELITAASDRDRPLLIDVPVLGHRGGA
jgi:benzoylformate decarboxylase